MNCKPGDLAIVFYTPNGQNVGSVVEVLGGWGSFGEYGHLWTVRFARPTQSHWATGEPSGIKTVMQCPDAWLKPVSGLPVGDEVTDDLEITA